MKSLRSAAFDHRGGYDKDPITTRTKLAARVTFQLWSETTSSFVSNPVKQRKNMSPPAASHGGAFIPDEAKHHNIASNSHGGNFIPDTNTGPSKQHATSHSHGGAFIPRSITGVDSKPEHSDNGHKLPSPPPGPAPPASANNQQQSNKEWSQGPQIVAGHPRRNPQQEGTLEPKAVFDHNVTPIESHPDNGPEEKEFPVPLKGSYHMLHSKTLWRWKNQNLFQSPGYVYADADTKKRHRDYAGRVSLNPASDRYLHHNDGYLRNLYVACTDELYTGPGNTTWKRTYIQKVAPRKVRIATWVVDFSYDPKSWNDWWIMVLRALPAAFAMQAVFWDASTTPMQRNGDYAPVLYAYHGDAKVWSNRLENRRDVATQARLRRNNVVYRVHKPRELCFLVDPKSKTNVGVSVENVEAWEARHGEDAELEYLFVAYSTEHFSHQSKSDLNALHEIAETACREAGLNAYWIACSCMADERELEADVFRIADVLRGANRMIIAVAPGPQYDGMKPSTVALLREWGSRMWTFPEVLLSPGRSIKVYVRGSDMSAPYIIPKNQFASKAWGDIDPNVSRSLVDHYLGNTDLSRIELSLLALQCLYSRHTTQYFAGDQAYALMGLLRLRPQIDSDDTAFQAFSRLSLANDSDKLLERYICILPTRLDQPWHDMSDVYDSSLWDITPYCQVAGIADQDTVIIDGAWGMSVRWKGFYPVHWSSGPSLKRWLAGFLMGWSGAFFIAGIAFVAASSAAHNPPLVLAGLIFLGLFFYFILMTPRLVRIIYGGKFTETQAEMFGFEGHLNAPTIERALFGGNFGRFSWSTNGSPLSRSEIVDGEKFGVDPAKYPEVRAKIEAAKHALPGENRIFTLVDTYTMELTLFEAVRPPSTLMFCASEGGMQRAVGCSYDWETQTMVRETVLRMPTPALNRMDRVPRFRLGIQRSIPRAIPRQGAA